MSIEIAELTAMRDQLVRMRAKGIRRGRMGDEEVEFRSDLEMANRIAELNRQIGEAPPQVRTVRFTTSKGV